MSVIEYFKFCKHSLPALLLIFFVCSNSPEARAQHQEKIYKTISGNIGFISVYHDSVVIASSDHLSVTMDYELATVQFSLDFNTLETKHDSLIHFFHSLIPLQLRFKGNLDVDYIPTDRHPPMKLEVTGVMTLNDIEKNKTIKGMLVYYPQKPVSSRLSMNFDLDLEDFELMEQFAGFHHIMKVEIAQAVLEKQK